MEVLERKEARAVLEEIAGSAAQRFRGIPPDVIAQDRTTQGAVDLASRRLAQATFVGGTTVAVLQTALRSATTRRRSFEAMLQAKFPAYYALLHPRPIRLEDLQRHVLGKDEALLAYDVMASEKVVSESVLLVVTRDRIAMFNCRTLPRSRRASHACEHTSMRCCRASRAGFCPIARSRLKLLMICRISRPTAAHSIGK